MLGCDIISIDRVKNSYDKLGKRLLDRILTGREQEIFFSRNESTAFLAGRFAAKEAISKAFKTGIGNLAFTDIEILPGESGQPLTYIRGERFAGEVSISHCREYAMAVCLIKEGV